MKGESGMLQLSAETLEELRRYKKQYLETVAFYKANGYTDDKAEYYAAHPKVLAYKLLLAQGLGPVEVVKYFRELNIEEGA